MQMLLNFPIQQTSFKQPMQKNDDMSLNNIYSFVLTGKTQKKSHYHAFKNASNQVAKCMIAHCNAGLDCTFCKMCFEHCTCPSNKTNYPKF